MSKRQETLETRLDLSFDNQVSYSDIKECPVEKDRNSPVRADLDNTPASFLVKAYTIVMSDEFKRMDETISQ